MPEMDSKPVLLTVAQCRWQDIATGQPQHILHPGAMDLEVRWQGGHVLDQCGVEHKRAGFQRICHTEAIHLHMQIVWQMGQEVALEQSKRPYISSCASMLIPHMQRLSKELGRGM
jgi:hypothetical protein